MTLVCVRLEASFGVARITALADARASIHRGDGTFKTISDTTTKLFAVPVRCYPLNLVPVIGAWVDPYFETMIGLGFSGSCFEALTVIAHVSQSLSALVAPNGDSPLPTRDGLVNLVTKLCESYFAHHSGEGKPILFLVLFGFEAGKPWIAKVTWDRSTGVQSSAEWATDSTLVTIGQDQLFRQYSEEWRTRIRRHKSGVAKKVPLTAAYGNFEQQLEISRHDVAERKSLEEEMLRQIESDFATGIGGVLQRLELGMEDGRVVAGFTHDDRPYLDGASYTVAPGTVLGPIPIVEKMGRQVRRPDV